MDIADRRREYTRETLDEAAVAREPLDQFRKWFDEALASELREPTAMAVATVGADGRPAARMVLLKGYDERGFVFYTNYESRKGRELAQNPHASLLFYWAELERQIRIEGVIEHGVRGGVRRVLQDPAARRADRRVGVAAEPGDRQGRTDGASRRDGAAARAEPRATAALGRLPPRARGVRVLAGAPIAPARPRRLPQARRRRLADRTARALGARAGRAMREILGILVPFFAIVALGYGAARFRLIWQSGLNGLNAYPRSCPPP